MLNPSWQTLSVTQPSRARLSVPTINLRQAATSSNALLERTTPLRWVALTLEKSHQQSHDARKQALFLALVLMAHVGILVFIMRPLVSLPLQQDSAPMIVAVIDFKKAKQTPDTVQEEKLDVVPVVEPKKQIKPKSQALPVVERMIEPQPEQPIYQAKTQENASAETVAAKSAPTQTETANTTTAKPVMEEKEEPPKFGVSYLNNPEPEYPKLSRRMSEQGKVLLKVLVNASGLPATVDIAKSSGYQRLDEAALQAVKAWKFEPARKGGVAMSAYVMVPLSFVLN